MNITKNLMTEIQNSLKVPKNQFNKFGGYRYRSCEDIVEAVKPLLAQQNLYLNISDEIMHIGERFYVKATVQIISASREIIAQSIAYAREEETKKGMDGSQITGAASSYARKYALNGLLGIDDTKDADTSEHTETTAPVVKSEPSRLLQVAGSKTPPPAKKPEPATENKEDARPWLTEKQFNQAMTRVSGGDLDCYHKTVAEFRMKKDYRKSLDEVFNFSKSLV